MKTADEMFRELGYSKISSDDYIPDAIVYAKAFSRLVIQPGLTAKYRLGRRGAHYIDGIYNEEVLACARLIKEMEADNGT